MDNFIVSARKYRPANWESVIGQGSITSTLQNAIANNHLAQAYLFCGPRGVGKTTCARIFARVINDANEGEDMSFNVFELDAASNNSVDDIRNLTDQVRVPPQTGNYKVYIIDEVHMLSQAAFNAFLKTLEEPPPHAIFILATTEKHKIIPTILSRCQIFDFNRIQVDDIANYLGTIAEKEGVQAQQDALHIIAQKADGAMRDALSIFDQLVSFAGDSLTYEAVIQNLNILDYDYYFKVADHVIKEDIAGALNIFDEILNHGFDGHNFIVGLAEHFRNLLVCKDESTVALLEVGENIKQRYLQQANEIDQIILIRGFDIMADCDVKYKASKNQRLLVELTLIQLCSIRSNEEKKNSNSDVTLLAPGEVSKTVPAPPEPVTINKNIDPTPSQASDNEGGTEVQTPSEPAVAEDPSAETSVSQEPVEAAADDEPLSAAVLDDVPTAKTTEAVVEKPRPVRKIESPVTLKTTTISISGLGIKKEEPEAEEEEQTGPTDEFDEAEFHIVWNKYAAMMLESGKDSFHSTLVKRTPELDGTTIKLTIDNLVQDQTVAAEKADLLEYVRTELNNFDLQLEIIMNETEDSVQLYTNKEKFSRMAEKNPALNKLRENFDLDLDY